MASPGLRERKRARTRLHIADTAARLFAERGYENVAVTDVAREAEVAEQTVYNYFPTKEQLVIDRDQQVQEGLSDLIRSRPPGITAAAAVRDFILGFVAGIRSIPPEQWRGELGYLAAISPTVRRLALEMLAHQADVIAAANIGCLSHLAGPDAPPLVHPAELIDWAEGGTISTLFSCLAAHAAVLQLDNIVRRPLPKKLSGVFPVAVDGQPRCHLTSNRLC